MVPDPLVLKRSQSGQSERSSEISSGVKNTGGIASICLCHRGYGSLVQEHHGQNHANTPNKLAFDEYGAPRFRGEAYADETARSEARRVGKEWDSTCRYRWAR